jgi:hypothetical protein
LIRPNVPSGAAPGVLNVVDQRQLPGQVRNGLVDASTDLRTARLHRRLLGTLTVSIWPPTLMVTSMFVTRPTSTMTPPWLNGVNPLRFTSTEYDPGFKRTTVKCPFASVTVVAVAFVALFFVVTVAPGTTDLV